LTLESGRPAAHRRGQVMRDAPTLSGYRTEGRQAALAAAALFYVQGHNTETHMSNKTPLYDEHVADGGKIVDFAGWEMPINYGSQIEEHNNVRSDAGMFDVSHMTASRRAARRCTAACSTSGVA
jgi:hypothetical protein